MEVNLNEKQAIIFENKKKSKQTHPDYRGWFKMDGKDYEITLWEKRAASGARFMSGTVDVPYKQRQREDNEEQERPYLPRRNDEKTEAPF